MKPIKIDIDAVPEDRRTHPDFLGLLENMTVGMADPAKVLSVCTHEAGHLFFGQELRMEILGMEGPQIVYIEPDRFQGHAARVKIKIVENTVEQAAIMLSAGGVFFLELDDTLGSGDTEDYELFRLMCQNAGMTDPASIHPLWAAGQNVVKARLKDPTFKSGMRELARRLVQDLEDAA